ncbi:MAG: hypothetical protein ACYS8I_00660 [Planctomycetota bacterium]|jgi:hypothetical protein
MNSIRRNDMVTAKRKTKTTFKIDAEILDQVIRLTKALGLRRDAYLSDMLDYGLDELERAPTNSPFAESVLKKMRDLRSTDEGVRRVNLNVDSDVLAKVNEACTRKRIARDMYVEKVMASLVEPSDWGPAPLHEAYNLIHNPYDGSPCDGSPFLDICLGDIDKEDFIDALTKVETDLRPEQ